MRDIRDGASLPRFFAMLNQYALASAPERLTLLRWAILQVLIGNVDGHAKNLSFFAGAEGLRLAPVYDLVCGLLYEQENVEDTLAMAIGDEFAVRKLGAYDWAQFSVNCGLPARLVAREMISLAKACIKQLPVVALQVREEGGNAGTIEQISAVVAAQAQAVLQAAPAIVRIVQEEWSGRV